MMRLFTNLRAQQAMPVKAAAGLPQSKYVPSLGNTVRSTLDCGSPAAAFSPSSLLLGVLLSLLLIPFANAAKPEAFLEQHCYDCHDEDNQKGGLNLYDLEYNLEDKKLFQKWVKVYDKVHHTEMPPKKKKPPEASAKNQFLQSLARQLEQADSQRQQQQGRGIVRRLNRVEFEAALSDLLGIPIHIREMLPPDAKGGGFDTVGAALNVSAVQMESYLQAIDTALDQATVKVPRPERHKWRLSYLKSHGPMVEYRRSGPHHPHEDGLAMFAPDFFSHFNSLMDYFVVAHSARYKVKVSAYAIRTKEPITLTVRMGGPGHKESDEVRKKLLGNVSVYPGKPQEFDFEEYLERGQMFRVYPSSLRKMRFEGKSRFGKQKDYKGPAVVVRWIEVDGPIYDSWPPASHQKLWSGIDLEPIPDVPSNYDPNGHLHHPPTNIAKPRIKQLAKPHPVTGNRMVYDPKLGIGGEKIYRRTRVSKPLHPTLKLVSQEPFSDSKRLLHNFANASFRSPADADELEPFVNLVHTWLKQGVPFEDAMRTGYKAILTSPLFLYHQGGAVNEGEPIQLSEYELAERLAFFLWNSLPDEKLLATASEGRLRKTLRTEVERMLDDPKSERFLSDFLGQWLDLHQIDFTAPDIDLYPEFDNLLKWSLVGETEAFFRELLKEDLSVKNVIHSDFAMLNDRLARHYEIPGVQGIEFRKVKLPPKSVRGGVMTQGSVLKVTANGTTTSPVVRGVWLMERILGQHPDPPPPGVPAIEPDIRGATTVREQLEQHRSVASCASCHTKIDPPGVALEEFDVIGGWRETYRAIDPNRSMSRVRYIPDGPPPIRYVTGLPVDKGDQFSDGRKFNNIQEFKDLLLKDPEVIARTVAEKLLAYSTGAPVSFADRKAIDAIVSESAGNEYGFRSLIHAVIQSKPFHIK